MSYFIEALKKYAVFSGRARRKEYWLFMLFAWIIYIALAAIAAVAHTPAIVAIAVVFLLPALAVTVRRLHDTGRSGWMILIGIVPLIGSIVLLVFYCSDSQAGANKYGPNPKEAPAFA
ncbi:DUF805 domain-containing protein [Streptomyces sp. NPDC058755]|uniref:DUF805 domain-containing protein n=1 Tax=unclassified Streptomyces TaxID=2593676 RepID=UPI0036A34D6E